MVEDCHHGETKPLSEISTDHNFPHLTTSVNLKQGRPGFHGDQVVVPGDHPAPGHHPREEKNKGGPTPTSWLTFPCRGWAKHYSTNDWAPHHLQPPSWIHECMCKKKPTLRTLHIIPQLQKKISTSKIYRPAPLRARVSHSGWTKVPPSRLASNGRLTPPPSASGLYRKFSHSGN